VKLLVYPILAFAAGLLVGTAGSDDSLLEQARQQESSAYDRGYADASAKFKAVAVQRGFATWHFDPHIGRRSQFVWMNSDGRRTLPDSMSESFAVTGWPDHQMSHLR
jgi:hypothetical protein